MFVLLYLCIRDRWASSSRSAIVSRKAFAVPLPPAVPSFGYRASIRFFKHSKDINLWYIDFGNMWQVLGESYLCARSNLSAKVKVEIRRIIFYPHFIGQENKGHPLVAVSMKLYLQYLSKKGW